LTVSALENWHITEDEFLRFEEEATYGAEYVDGTVRLMSGASVNHGVLAGLLFGAVLPGALAKGCRSSSQGTKLRFEHGNRLRYYLPDVMVVCSPRVDDGYETSPCLVVEVLSKTTTGVDMWEKRLLYQSIESVEAYVVADPESPTLLVYRRDTTGEFAETKLGVNDRLVLACPPTDVAVADLYQGVAFPST
jgi:Uma2 family endonuclease